MAELNENAAPDVPESDASGAEAPDAKAAPGQIEALQRERDALQDRLLRTAAEFDNYRKRMDRERRDLAVIHEASADHREGEVMQELQRGYLLGDRLLRPAMVKVAKPFDSAQGKPS